MRTAWFSAQIAKTRKPRLRGLAKCFAEHRDKGAGLPIPNSVSCFLHRISCDEQFDPLHKPRLASPGLKAGPDLALKNSLDCARARTGIVTKCLKRSIVDRVRHCGHCDCCRPTIFWNSELRWHPHRVMKICNQNSFESCVKCDPPTKSPQSHRLDDQLPEQRRDVEDGTMVWHLIRRSRTKI